MKAIIVTTASMIVNIHIMENKLTSIYNVKTQKKAACRQINILQKRSVVSLHYLTQHNRSEAMRATCMCVCVCVCVHQCVRVYVCWGEWSVGGVRYCTLLRR